MTPAFFAILDIEVPEYPNSANSSSEAAKILALVSPSPLPLRALALLTALTLALAGYKLLLVRAHL